MPRDGKRKNASEKSQAERYAGELATKLIQKLCSEKVFPRRSRWLIAKKIADLTVEFHSAVHYANGIKVATQGERDERHKAQTLALAKLYAVDAELTVAMDVLHINPDDLGEEFELPDGDRSDERGITFSLSAGQAEYLAHVIAVAKASGLTPDPRYNNSDDDANYIHLIAMQWEEQKK